MSSDDDELANYDNTTTPFRAVKLDEALRHPTKATKPNGRAAVAGPSSRAGNANAKRSRKRSPTPPQDVEEEEGPIEVPAPTRKATRPRRAASREPEPVTQPKPKATTHSKAKGKSRAEVVKDALEDVMDIDDLEAIRETDGAETEDTHTTSQPPPPSRKPQNKPVHAGQAAWKRQEARLREQIGRLEVQLAEVIKQRDEFANQMDEYLSLSKTQVEENYESQVTLYESRLEKQEEMIGELTSQLARVNVLIQEGKTSTLHFITREAADEERRGVERQNDKLKDVVRGKDNVIAEKDKTIQERDEEIRLLQAQLKAEIERSNMERNKALSVRPNAREIPSSATKSRKAPTDKFLDTKHGMVVRLYEDTTGLLIIDCKHEEADYDDDIWLFNCIYSCPEIKNSRSLNFTLRCFHDTHQDESTEEVEVLEKMNYTPMGLENESDAFVRALGVLAEEFTFDRRQMETFLVQLREILEAAIEADANAGH